MSYSGLKTAVINQKDRFLNPGHEDTKENIAASFQRQAVNILMKRVKIALKDTGLKRISAGGGVGSIILSSSDDSVKTDSNGDVVMYAYIVPKNTVNLVTDRNVTITYADDTEFNVGVLKFAGKTVELGKCYTVTFDLISANTVIENFENAGEITF